MEGNGTCTKINDKGEPFSVYVGEWENGFEDGHGKETYRPGESPEVGDDVEVNWKGTWYNAVIIRTPEDSEEDPNQSRPKYRVKFDGDNTAANVSREKIRHHWATREGWWKNGTYQHER